MILIWTSLMWYAWDGPYWIIPNPVRTMADTCVDKWYLNLLYVNNLFNPWFSVGSIICFPFIAVVEKLR